MNQGGWPGGPAQPGGGPPEGSAPPQQGYPQPQQQQPYAQPQQPQQQQPYAQPQQPQQQPYAQPQAGYAPTAMHAVDANAAKGFLSGLIDFSFTTFIATKVIKVLYGLLLLAIALGMLGAAWNVFDYMFLRSRFHPEGFIQLVIIPFAGAAAVVVARLYCELLVVVFRIADNLAELNRKTKE